MGQAAAMLLTHSRRNDQFGEFFSYRFSASKAEGAFGGGIKFHNAPIRIHRDDAIERVIENAAIQHFELIARDTVAVSPGFFGFHLERVCRLHGQTNKSLS